MKVAVITPLGLGHEQFVLPCRRSVGVASDFCSGIEVEHIILTDDGRGRSATRNAAMEQAEDADWYFFLDADDEMTQTALVDFQEAIQRAPEAGAVLGDVFFTDGSGKPRDYDCISKYNKRPESWADIQNAREAMGLFAISNFFKAEPARRLGFHKGTSTVESHEFVMAFLVEHDWVRSRCPLALIFRNRPSACGPVGYGDKNFKWADAIQPVHDFWRERGRVPLSPEERAGLYWM